MLPVMTTLIWRLSVLAVTVILTVGPGVAAGDDAAGRTPVLASAETLQEMRASAHSPALPFVFAPQVVHRKGKTHFSMRMSAKLPTRAFVLAEPARVVVEIPDVEFRFVDSGKDKSSGLVRGFRYGRFSQNRSRIVFDVTGAVKIERAGVRAVPIATDTRGEEEGEGEALYTLVLSPTDRVSFEKAAALAAAQQRAPRVHHARLNDATLSGKSSSYNEEADAVSHARQPVIVLDPGHGGIDGGTTGRAGTREKVVVLAFAKSLRQYLQTHGQFQVLLTREDDRFVSLPDRLQFAKDAKADLFISIHADAFNENSVRGTTVYTLSKKASDRYAAAYAQKENAADLVAGLSTADMPATVASILDELMLRETKAFSILLARQLISNIKKVTQVRKYPHKRANFFVLSAPDIPSVLIELGYMSNARDEQRLRSLQWRDKVAQTIATAIQGYFSKPVAQEP